MAQYTVLVPCAGPLPADGRRPSWLLTTPTGELAVTRAVMAIPAPQIARVVIGVSQMADQKFGAAEALRRSFAASQLRAPEIVIVDHPTRGAADTVELMIEQAAVEGPVAIKDAHGIFQLQAPLPDSSFIAVSDLRENLDTPRVGQKSFVLCNEQGLVSDIIEKEVCSNLISVGLYGFADAQIFRKHFLALSNAAGAGAFFVSHIMSEAIAGGDVVEPVKTRDFVQADDHHSWRGFCERHKTLVLDIDGVVFRNHSRFFAPFWEEDDTPIDPNVQFLLKLQAEGAQLVFMTARPDEYRQKTLNALLALGLNVHGLITGCNHARRLLVNDFAPSNPYPSATAVNLARNAADLEKMVG
jgi:hypothetical protein